MPDSPQPRQASRSLRQRLHMPNVQQILMCMCMSNLRDKREQHAKQNNSDVSSRHALVPRVSVHVAIDLGIVV
jgi:hypothetical protein